MVKEQKAALWLKGSYEKHKLNKNLKIKILTLKLNHSLELLKIEYKMLITMNKMTKDINKLDLLIFK